MSAAGEAERGDEAWMARALALAERGRGLTSPNPLVGAVAVAAGRVVGEGWHERAGQPHAEPAALAAAGPAARGATLYVTLEPCNHQGRTPPCTEAILRAGVARVVAAVADPNPLVPGGGAAALRAAGVQVRVGCLEAEARRQNRVFFTAARRGRPHVTLKWAMTLDGKIAAAGGESRWITSEPARAHAHRLRAEADAIVVGVGTALADDPELTVRLPGGWPREPLRVVLDSRGRLPAEARLLKAGTPGRAIVAVTAAAGPGAAALEAAGATVLRCAAAAGRVDPGDLLAQLFRREVRAVLVEGGAEVHGAFLGAGLVDRVVAYVAPRLLGGRQAPGPAGGPGRRLAQALELAELTVSRAGQDLVIEGHLGGNGEG